MKLWEKHLLRRLIKAVGALLFAIFSLYIVIDLSIHGVRFFAGKANLLQLLLYYVHSFSRHLDLFVSLAYLLSLLKVLSDLANHSELIALQMAGLSKRRLARPLFATASLLTLLSLANAQWLSPDALDSIGSFRIEHAKKKRSAPKERVHASALDDGSEIVFQRFDWRQKTLFDVFWIRRQKQEAVGKSMILSHVEAQTQDGSKGRFSAPKSFATAPQIWHIKRLDLDGAIPLGRCIEILERDKQGKLLLVNSHLEMPIEDLSLLNAQSLQKFIPFENRPLATLAIQSFLKSADNHSVRAHLHYKLALACLPLLIATSLTPHLFAFSRTKSLFLIAALSLFAFIAFLTLLDGVLILTENRVLPPAPSIWALWLFCFLPSLHPWIDKKSSS